VDSAEHEETRECCAKEVSNSNFFYTSASRSVDGRAAAFQSSSPRGAAVVHDGSFGGVGRLKSSKEPRYFFLESFVGTGISTL
jgi:hypothetical protein